MTYIRDYTLLDNRKRTEMREWLEDRRFTHVATLAFNDPMTTDDGAKAKLRAWDARMCRVLLGARWLKKPDERLVWFATWEKPGTNPHWHLLIDLPERHVESFARKIDPVWCRLVRSGSTDLQRIYDKHGIVDYVTKEMRRPECFEGFIHSLEFIRAGN